MLTVAFALESVFFVAVLLVLAAAYSRLYRYLFPDLQDYDRVRWSFACVLAVASVLFLVVICEIVDFLGPASRKFWWRLSLMALLSATVIVLPFLIVFNYLDGKGWPRARAVTWSTVGLVVWLLVFWRIGVSIPMMQQTPLENSFVQYALARVGVIGVAVMATLSGFGVVQTPYQAFWVYSASVNDTAIGKKNIKLLKLVDDVALLKQKRAVLLAGRGRQAQPVTTSLSSLLGGLLRGQAAAPLEDLDRRIAAMNSAIRDVFMDVHRLALRKAEAEQQASLWGRAMRLSSYVWSLYCVYKLVMTTLTIVLNRAAGPDPITRLIGFALKFALDIDPTVWAMYASFGFVGMLAMSAVRNFLLNFYKIQRSFFHGVTPATAVLVIVQLMGMYLASSILQVRNAIPVVYRNIITEAASSLHFDFYRRWFDAIFLMAAACSFIVVVALELSERKT